MAQLGLPVKLPHATVLAADRITTRCVSVLSVENETAFRLLRERYPERLLVFSGGQASWSAIELLRKLGNDREGLQFFHTGDLDRTGLLILRSLRERTGLDIRPLWMDGATYDAFADCSLEMKPSEVEHASRLLEDWQEPFGREVLERLVEHRRWIEQEQIVVKMGIE